MARKARRRKAPKQVALELSDYQYPDEKSIYWQAVGGMLVVFFGIAVVGLGLGLKAERFSWQWLYLPVWGLVAVWLTNLLSTRRRRKELKAAGRQAKVMGNNHPQLYELLVRQCQLINIKPPDMYLIDDDAPYIYSLPGRNGTVIVTQPLLDLLDAEEFATLLTHELGHIKSHHVRMDLALTYVKTCNPVMKLVLLPVVLTGALLRGWPYLIDYSADRVAWLACGAQCPLALALVKLTVAFDESSEVSQQDIEAYLSAPGDLDTADADQMERHFRLGRYISQQPNLRERIEQIVEFPRTEQGQQALQKMAEIRRNLGAQSAAG